MLSFLRLNPATSLLVGCGVIVFAAKMACDRYYKAHDELEKLEEEIASAHAESTSAAEPIKTKYKILSGVFGDPISLGAIGVIFILSGYISLADKNERANKYIRALKVDKKSIEELGWSTFVIFNRYRKQIVDSYGVNVDKNIFNDVNQFVNGVRLKNEDPYIF